MFFKSIRVAGYVSFAAIFAVGCDAGKTSGPKQSASVPSYAVASTAVTVSYGIGGYVVLPPAGAQLYLAAAKMSDGTVRGQEFSGLSGNVVEVVRPTSSLNYWCVNVLITSDPAFAGFNYLWYIRDIGNGKTAFDEVATNGDFGLTCAAAPVPSTVFMAVTGGDFKAFSK